MSTLELSRWQLGFKRRLYTPDDDACGPAALVKSGDEFDGR